MNKKLFFHFRIDIAAGLMIVLSAILAMFPAVRNEYVNWDDRAFVASEFKGNILSIRNFKEIFAKTVQCEYVPLVKLSFAAENLAAKRNPAVSHAINIAFHSVVSLLVFIFFLSVSGNMVAAFISALLFAVHPLHAEPVAWVSGRKDLLFAIFYLSALVFYLRFKLCRGKVYYYLCLASFILSLLSKSMAVTLPLSMLLVDYFYNEKITFYDVKEKILFFVLAAFFSALSVYTQSFVEIKPHYGLLQRIFFPGYVFLFHIIKLIFPANLSAIYPYPESASGFLPAEYYIFSAVAVSLLLFVIFVVRKKNKIIYFCCLFFLISFLPGSQIISIPWVSVTYDRISYLPSAGLFFILGILFTKLWDMHNVFSKIIKTELLILFVICAVFLVMLSRERTTYWKNDFILYSDIIRKYPGVSVAYTNRGHAALEYGDYVSAFDDFSTAIEINPLLPDNFLRRAAAYYNTGEYDLGLADIGTAIRLVPDSPEAYLWKGALYEAKEDYYSAIESYTRAIKLREDHPVSYNNRGSVYLKMKEYSCAINDFNRAIKLDLYFSQAYFNRGTALIESGQYEKGEKDIKKFSDLFLEESKNY